MKNIVYEINVTPPRTHGKYCFQNQLLRTTLNCIIAHVEAKKTSSESNEIRDKWFRFHSKEGPGYEN